MADGLSPGRPGYSNVGVATLVGDPADVDKRSPLTKLLREYLDKDFLCPLTGEMRKAKEIIAHQTVNLAVQGDKWAISFIFDRVEGKAVEKFDIGGSIPTSLCELIHMGLQQANSNGTPTPGGDPDRPFIRDGLSVIDAEFTGHSSTPTRDANA